VRVPYCWAGFTLSGSWLVAKVQRGILSSIYVSIFSLAAGNLADIQISTIFHASMNKS
jgi:hypothetical protein